MGANKVASLVVLTSVLAAAQSTGMNVLVVKTEADTRAFFHYTGKDLPIISAHRGGSEVGYPENTISAFEHTLQATPAMFETDPRVTKDGQLLVMHDATLDRTTMEHGPVKDRTLAELEQITMKDSAGNKVEVHPPSLDALIEWAKGKTVLNLDIKDATPQQRLAAVEKRDAFGTVLFTVHSAAEAQFFYAANHRSLMACVIFTPEQMKTYEDAGVPWGNIAIAYVGAGKLPKNEALYDALHAKGVMVMVSSATAADHLPDAEQRGAAYRKIISDGADVLESDRPIEVAAAIRGMYPAGSKRYRFWGKRPE